MFFRKPKIARLIVGSGEESADIRYATNLSTPDNFIWFEVKESKDNTSYQACVMSSLEYDRAKEHIKKGVDVLRSDDFLGNSIKEQILSIAKKFNLTAFEVPETFPLSIADFLRKNKLKVTPVAGTFFPNRAYKEDSEVEKITISLRAAEAGLTRAREVLALSTINNDQTLSFNGELLTSELLRYEIDSTMLKLGMAATGTICAGALQGAQPHNVGSGPLYANTPIVLDVFPRSLTTGYWGDLTRTQVKGKATDIVKKAFIAVRDARDKSKELLHAGVIPEDVHNFCTQYLAEQGFPTGFDGTNNYGFFHGLGHGLGLEIHEAPRLSKRAKEPFKGGEIVTVEPGVYYPQWGGIRMEDLVYINKDGNGIKCLTQIDDTFEIE